MIWDKDEYENKIYFQTWLSTYNAVKECIKLYKTPLICEDFYVTVNNVKVNLNAWIKMQLKLLSHNMLSEKQISMLRNIGIDNKLGNVMEDLCLLTKRNY